MDVSESWFWYYIWCVNEERRVHFWKKLKFSLYWVYSKCLTRACVQVESTKKSYHQARKEEWTAANREAHAKADPTKSQEEVRKYTTRVERCNQDTEKVRCTHTWTHTYKQSPIHSSSCTSLGVSDSRKTYLCMFFNFETWPDLSPRLSTCNKPNGWGVAPGPGEGNDQPNNKKNEGNPETCSFSTHSVVRQPRTSWAMLISTRKWNPISLLIHSLKKNTSKKAFSLQSLVSTSLSAPCWYLLCLITAHFM